MPAKKKKDERQWYSKSGDGHVSGPFDAETMRGRVLSGEVQAETPVSPDTATWTPAAAVPELGFDCLVMRVDKGIEVLGPFAREYLDNPAVMGKVPRESVFFVRSGTVGEAADAPDSIGKTGADLVERVVEARKALRASNAARTKAEAALKAKDLEFDAERQHLSAEISALKAEALKLRGEMETLRAEAEKAAGDEQRTLETEAKLVDAEKAAAASESALRVAQSRAAAAEKDLAETRAALDEAKAEAVKAANAGAERDREISSIRDAHAKELAAARADAEKASREAAAAHAKEIAALKDEAGKAAKAHERELAAVRSGAERAAKESDDEHARAIAELRAAALEATRKADAENAALRASADAEIAAARADADWLRERLSGLFAEVSTRFAPPAEPAAAEPAPPPAAAEPSVPPPGPGGRDARESVFVEAEAIDDPPSGFHRPRIRPVPEPEARRAAKPAAEESRKPLSGMAALEDQLKDELRRAADAAQATGRGAGAKIMNFFKRK